MKKIFILLAVFIPLLVFSQEGIKIGGTFVRNHPLDKFPLMDVTDVKGAFMVVSDTNFMLDYPETETVRGLPEERRTEGMIVYVQDINTYYKLNGGVGNDFWEEIDIEGGGDAGEALYIDTDRPTKYIGDGVTLGNPNMRIDSAISLILYAEEPPSASIGGLPVSPFEKGQAAGVSLFWEAEKNGSSDISSITVAGESITPTGDTQSGTKEVVVTANISYTITVEAGGMSASDNTTYVLLNRVYMGMLSGLANPIDTEFQEPNGNPSSPYYQLTDADILDEDLFPYNTLSSDYPSDFVSLDNTTPPSRFVVAVPSSFGEPEVSTDGSFYSSMTLQKRWEFINQYGYTEEYEIYVLYTDQNRNPFTFKIREAN